MAAPFLGAATGAGSRDGFATEDDGGFQTDRDGRGYGFETDGDGAYASASHS